MRRVLMTILVAAPLGGCGTYTTFPYVPYIGAVDRPLIVDDSTVQIVSTGPALSGGGVPVSGESCKTRVWQADPTEGQAMSLMKRQASERGLRTIQLVRVYADPGAFDKNCLAAIIVEGVAFR